MFKIILLLFVCATCYGDVPVTPPTQPQVFCGFMPENIFSCLGNPTVIKKSVSSQSCMRSSNECDKMTCVFRNAGWLTGTAVNKEKVVEYLNEFAAEHPAWAPAVQHAKAACLAPELPAQGTYLNCPAYDILTCTLASFIKHAQPSQWSTSQTCEGPRQYAASCPVCPEKCFSAAIPIGSCNACYALPRTP
nr:odorant-binding protein 10 [Glyphodes caesalis]